MNLHVIYNFVKYLNHRANNFKALDVASNIFRCNYYKGSPIPLNMYI